MAVNNFPDEEVLIARGKYATLASERRALLHSLRHDMEAITEHARRVVRSMDSSDTDFAMGESQAARQRIEDALGRLTSLVALAHHLSELKPLAWGKKEPLL